MSAIFLWTLVGWASAALGYAGYQLGVLIATHHDRPTPPPLVYVPASLEPPVFIFNHNVSHNRYSLRFADDDTLAAMAAHQRNKQRGQHGAP